LHLPRQIAQENCCALEHADKHNGLARKIAGDFRTHRAHAISYLLARDENPEFRHGDSY
jgi:hypothetical protein